MPPIGAAYAGRATVDAPVLSQRRAGRSPPRRCQTIETLRPQQGPVIARGVAGETAG